MNAVVDFPVKPEAQPYLDVFAETADEPDWLRRARRASLTRFAELGFPTRRSENWRYLDLRPLEAHPMLPAVMGQPMGVPNGLALEGSAARIVLVDGCFAPELSQLDLPPGVWLGSTRKAIAQRADLVKAFASDPGTRHPFGSLNAAFFADGFVLEVGCGVVLDAPIEIIHLASGAGDASLHTRSMIELCNGSRATIVETFAGSGRYWRNDCALWRVAGDAALTRIALVEEAGEATHFEDIDAVLLLERARLNSFSLLLGGGTVRQEISVAMSSVDAECRIDGAFAVSGAQETNIVSVIDHQLPGGTTSELIKGVAAGRGHGAFQGTIKVREGAQQTDARQTSRNLILGRRASIDTKPELEILADDVKCAHGASVGELDETALFYLRSRGIPTEDARRLLIEGFLREPIEGIADAAIREHLLRRLSLRLARLEDQ
ncbi:MAG TPA: Fe-S cluster assembly protein SufD [Stellaceae bacterium]|jgi:Fe-S cluster assembly protein SufD|nr:Fe-S cluster assembly protein SufD [Stellaceae bacterium]